MYVMMSVSFPQVHWQCEAEGCGGDRRGGGTAPEGAQAVSLTDWHVLHDPLLLCLREEGGRERGGGVKEGKEGGREREGG